MSQPWPLTSAAPKLAADEVHVWLVALDSIRAPWGEQWAILSRDERERAERFRLDAPRRRFVTSRAALRALLGQYLDKSPIEIVLEYATNGKPRLHQPEIPDDLQFNVAHSNEMGLIAFARGCEVGIDIEHLRIVAHWQQIADRYFHPQEIAQIKILQPGAQLAAFMRCWTAKEAVLKALGTGVTQSLSFFVGQREPPESSWVEATRHSNGTAVRCWLQPLTPADDYIAALACLNTQRNMRCFHYSGSSRDSAARIPKLP
jgi:4'-phosphopantetheinyl transferase